MVTATEFDQLLDVLRDFIRGEVMPAERASTNPTRSRPG